MLNAILILLMCATFLDLIILMYIYDLFYDDLVNDEL
jgi:hypothetical protein